MAHVDPGVALVGKPVRFSYWFMAGVLVLIGWHHLGGVFTAALFAYLALDTLHFFKRKGKWISVVFCVALLAGIAYALGYVIHAIIKSLPEIAENAIPGLIDWAQKHGIELPFTDYESLKEMTVDWVKGQAKYLGEAARFAQGATGQFLLVLIACVIAIGLFLNPHIEIDRDKQPIRNNLFSLCGEAISDRFNTFYRSFAIVMGGQVIIAIINSVLTAIFVFATGLPYAVVIIGATFLCELVPVVGNLVSNTLVVGIAMTVSPHKALLALIFLVVVHKLEYFLNSKIVGHRIRNPFWLTLLALVV